MGKRLPAVVQKERCKAPYFLYPRLFVRGAESFISAAYEFLTAAVTNTTILVAPYNTSYIWRLGGRNYSFTFQL